MLRTKHEERPEKQKKQAAITRFSLTKEPAGDVERNAGQEMFGVVTIDEFRNKLNCTCFWKEATKGDVQIRGGSWNNDKGKSVDHEDE